MGQEGEEKMSIEKEVVDDKIASLDKEKTMNIECDTDLTAGDVDADVFSLENSIDDNDAVDTATELIENNEKGQEGEMKDTAIQQPGEELDNLDVGMPHRNQSID